MVSTMSHHMMLSQGWPALTHSLSHSSHHAPTGMLARSSHSAHHSASPWNAGILLDVPSTPPVLSHGAWRSAAPAHHSVPRASPRAGSPARRRSSASMENSPQLPTPVHRRRAPPPPPQHHQQHHHQQQQHQQQQPKMHVQPVPQAFPSESEMGTENSFSMLLSPAPASVTGYSAPAPAPAPTPAPTLVPAQVQRRRITSYTQSPAPGGGFTYALHTSPPPPPTPTSPHHHHAIPSAPAPAPTPASAPARRHHPSAPTHGYASSSSRASEYALARQRQRALADKEARLKVIASILLNRVNVVGRPMRRRSVEDMGGRGYVRSGLGREVLVGDA